MTDTLRAVMNTLTPLLGRWRGEGSGSYPTIKPFEFRDECCFELDSERPLIHYEQRTTHREIGTSTWVSSHWESGFLRPIEARIVELTNAQDSGRLEIIPLILTTLPGGLSLRGESTGLFNDPRLAGTMRRFELQGDTLSYEVRMATTRVPVSTVHLQATLTRVDR